MSRLDTLREELVAVQQRLDDLPVDAFDERIRLRDQQRELRAEVRRHQNSDRLSLEEELDRLTLAWDRLSHERIDIVKQSGDLSAGGNFGFATDALRLNQRIDSAEGRAALEERIRELRRLLG